MDFPIIKLYRNPWSQMLPNGVVLQALMTAAVDGQSMLADWKEGGHEPQEKSFGLVILDPTHQRILKLEDRVLAVIELGQNGYTYLPNGLAKADAHERNGVRSRHLLESDISCLGNDDFIWGSSADYGPAIAGGSGLKPEHDETLAEEILSRFIDRIEEHLEKWVEEMKAKEGSHRWFNSDDHVPDRYDIFDSLEPIAEHE